MGSQEDDNVIMEKKSDTSDQSTLLFEIDAKEELTDFDGLCNDDSISFRPSEYEDELNALIQDLHRTSLFGEAKKEENDTPEELFYDLSPISIFPVSTNGEAFPIDGNQSLRRAEGCRLNYSSVSSVALFLVHSCHSFQKKGCSENLIKNPEDSITKASHISRFPELTNIHSIPVTFSQRKPNRTYFSEHDLLVSCIPTIIPEMKQITMNVIQNLDVARYEQATDEIILEFLDE